MRKGNIIIGGFFGLLLLYMFVFFIQAKDKSAHQSYPLKKKMQAEDLSQVISSAKFLKVNKTPRRFSIEPSKKMNARWECLTAHNYIGMNYQKSGDTLIINFTENFDMRDGKLFLPKRKIEKIFLNDANVFISAELSSELEIYGHKSKINVVANNDGTRMKRLYMRTDNSRIFLSRFDADKIQLELNHTKAHLKTTRIGSLSGSLKNKSMLVGYNFSDSSLEKDESSSVKWGNEI
ncbi:MAG: hypothetical protein MI784_07160 [Cytophagales bacterium]|nr:hypothetical protein [Cytophagales bacterium]